MDQFDEANNGTTISARRFAQELAAHGNQVRVIACGKPASYKYAVHQLHFFPLVEHLVNSQGLRLAIPNRHVFEKACAWADVVHFLMAFGDVYTFGPTFRAENSNTQRHAAEFWMIEPEMAFTDLAGDMDVAEAMIKFIIRRVMERCPDEMAFFNSFVDKGLVERLTHVMTSDFGRVTYTEAVDILMKHNDQFDYKVKWGTDLQTEHERYLTEQVFKKPVFVTDYPKEIKAFYMRLNDDGKTVAAADCLVPGIGEIIGGSQREERLEMLETRIRELGMRPEDYWWYCDLRRYGSCKHAGFGLGFERMVMYLTGVANIRDVELHPRTVGNADF